MKQNNNSCANPYEVDRSLYHREKGSSDSSVYMRIIIPFIGETRGRGREDGAERKR
jgi:hypothetical protein